MVMSNEENTYLVPRALVHRAIWSIIVGIVTIGIYMVIWGMTDRSWKTSIDLRLEHFSEAILRNERIIEDQIDDLEKDHNGRLRALESSINQQILPRAQWEINQLKKWVEDHEHRVGVTPPFKSYEE